MMFQVRTTIYSVTLVLAIILLPSVAEACKCGRVTRNADMALKETLLHADVVIQGTVQSVTPTVLPEISDEENQNDLQKTWY